uniref:Indoleamine 2,3-dioxygenase 1 n=1 Tax=Sphaeramia orbicularis TaxID=375764 RepID=A0A673AC36_9TELE
YNLILSYLILSYLILSYLILSYLILSYLILSYLIMPVLSPHHLNSHRELRLAHLALGFITMGYVWQEGQHAPAQILPKALALPYCLVSRRLGLPPILTYADSVLANWKLKDPTGNIDAIFSFPGGESCRGFFIVSLLVEMTASSGITCKINTKNAFHCTCIIYKKCGLWLKLCCFRWRDNPMLPKGLLYEGVSNEPVLLSGGSAAQSSAIQCFDALLCIRHEDETGAFLTRMRDYMPPAQCQLIETLSAYPSLRDFIMSRSSSALCQVYNSCVSALVDLRNYHLNIVAKYVIVPANQARAVGCPLTGRCTALDSTGTGGSSLMNFLKSVRNSTQKALISECSLEKGIQKLDIKLEEKSKVLSLNIKMPLFTWHGHI